MGEAQKVDPVINATIGNYKVTRKIGEGGMGSVYLAEHPLIGKKVALKVLHPEFSANEDVVTRFFNEAKAVNDIQHPNIVDIIDYGVIPSAKGGDMVYFIMEHLDGNPLEDVIAEQSPLSPERSLHICVQVADALAASHKANIIHRDLKPDNIILIKKRKNDDFVKLLDFGIAKLTGDQPGSSKTRTGIVMGTPAYMSPEQCEGKGLIDVRTDVYALGIVLYQMITGRVPFEGEGYGEVLVQHLTQKPASPSTLRGAIPPHVEAICMKALEKKPDNRFQNMEDFIAALTDPVSFVEANGGLAGFASANLGAAVLPPIDEESSVGHESGYYTPVSGRVSTAKTQLPEPDFSKKKSKAPIFIGIGVLTAGTVALAMLMGGGDSPEAEVKSETKPAAVSVEVKPKVEPKKPEVTLPPTKLEPKVVKVQASLASTPTNAEIYGPSGFVGRTPVKLTDYASDDLPITFTLKKEGYEDTEVLWSFNPEQRKQRYKLDSAQLLKIKKAKSGTGRGKKKRQNLSKKNKDEGKKAEKKVKKIGDNNLAPSF